MDWSQHNSPLSLRDIQVTDPFWKNEMELVRTEVIPYYMWVNRSDEDGSEMQVWTRAEL